MLQGQELVLYLGVTPAQRLCLQMNLPAVPDEFSGRFGLRTAPPQAIQRAHYFMECTPSGERGDCTLGDMKAVKVILSPFGYMQKMEGGILECRRPGEYRWHGSIAPYELDHMNRLLYRVEEFEMVVLDPWNP